EEVPERGQLTVRQPGEPVACHAIEATDPAAPILDLWCPTRGVRRLMSPTQVQDRGEGVSPAGQALVQAGAAQCVGERAAARRWPAPVAVAARLVGARPLGPATRRPPYRLVLQSQGQRDPPARDVDLEHLDPDDVPGLRHVARILDER